MTLDEIAKALNSEIGRMAQLAFAGLIGACTNVIFKPVDKTTTWRAQWLAVLTGLGFAIYVVPSAVSYFFDVHISNADRTAFQLCCAACYLGGMVGNNLIPVLIDKAPKALGAAIERFFNRGGGA